MLFERQISNVGVCEISEDILIVTEWCIHPKQPFDTMPADIQHLYCEGSVNTYPGNISKQIV